MQTAETESSHPQRPGATAAERAAKINDSLRRSVGRASKAADLLGEVHTSAGVDALPNDVRARVLEAVRTSRDFSCDETGERACGIVEVEGLQDAIVWRVECFERAAYPRALHPAAARDNAARTVRRLTVALAEEF